MLYSPDVENRNPVKINPMKFFIQAKYFVHFECRSRHRRTGVEQRTVSRITLSWKAGEVVEHQKRRRISSMMLVCDGQSWFSYKVDVLRQWMGNGLSELALVQRTAGYDHTSLLLLLLPLIFPLCFHLSLLTHLPSHNNNGCSSK